MTDSATETPAVGSDEHLTMGIDPFERNWMRVSILLLVVFFVTVSIAGFAMGFQVPGVADEVDPRTVLTQAPWDEPGLRMISEGHYEAHVVAQTWAFVPRELEVPVGSTVDIYVTSPDLQHGLKITDTNVNTMVVPGQVSNVSFTFDQVGEFPYICHEYCGSGHAAMFGVVKVVSPAASGGDEADESTGSTGDTQTSGTESFESTDGEEAGQ